MAHLSPELLAVLRCPVTGSSLVQEGEELVSSAKDASASHTKPAAITSGTATSSTPTPRRWAMRPVMNSWLRMASACTTVSIRPNTCVCRALSGNSASTNLACSK